jgi:hypothetical protein
MQFPRLSSGLLIIILFSTGYCQAQQDSLFTRVADSNTVIVNSDPRLALLVKKHTAVNEVLSRDARRTDKGFRLMILSTTSRDEAMAAKTKVYSHFPELKAYLWYQSPYFRLKAGNFKERKDAEDYQRRLNALFPKGVFIMNDVIEVKPTKSSEPEDLYPRP